MAVGLETSTSPITVAERTATPDSLAGRIPAIDLLRGIVMVIMTIDHAREYSAGPGRVTDPMDLDHVTPLLYAMRWISHFCAPVFSLLMGMSAGLSRSNPPGSWSVHLVKRGLVLVALEFTVIDWSWTFNPLWPRKFWQVIAALGCASIVLGVMNRWSRGASLATGLAITALHNLGDGVSFSSVPAHYVWSILHQKNVLPLWAGFEFRTTYPILPIVGVSLIGFGLSDWIRRRDGFARLARVGATGCLLFLALRITNLYGDASRFSWDGDWVRALQSVGNVTKYPLSLQFVLMTVSPALIFLGGPGRRISGSRWWQRTLITLGRNPLAFYIGHLYLLHALALIWVLAQGLPWANFAVRFGGIPAEFGFPLWQTIPFSLFTTALLIPACSSYEAWRRARRQLKPAPEGGGVSASR